MATSKETADFFLEQLEGRGVSLRRMFGEYAIYAEGKTVGFLCDDTLFVRQIPEATAYLGDPVAGHPYPGSKLYWQVDPDQWEDSDWLAALISLLAEALPVPKPKRPKRPKSGQDA